MRLSTSTTTVTTQIGFKFEGQPLGVFQCKIKLVMNSESKGLFVCGLIVTFYTFALKVNETLFANYFNDFNLPEKFPLN